MALFAWDPAYSIGVAAIDAEHRQLFVLADRLHTAMKSGAGAEVLENTLARLIDYTREHFRHEEEFMSRCAYPEIQAHKALHATLTQKVLDYQRDFRSRRTAMTVDILHFLKTWLASHICETDRRLAAYSKSKVAV